MRTWTKASLDAAAAEFLWSQWAQLGISATRRADRWAVDPEALLLFGLRFGPREPRLFGELLDWLRLNGRFVSTKRLRNLARDERSRRLVDAALAWAGTHNPSLQLWAKGAGAGPLGSLEPLAQLYIGELDPVFSAFGFAWPRTKPSGKSVSVDVSRPIGLAFRLRLVFGVGARAEIVRYLLTSDHPESSTSEVAHAAGFGQRNVRDALTEMTEAGVIASRPKGRGHVFSLEGPRWTGLLGVPSRSIPSYLDWIRLLSALWEIVGWFDEDARVERSDYLRASEARQLVTRIRTDLLAAGIQVPHDPAAHGAEYWNVFQSVVDSVIGKLRVPAA